MFVNFNILNQLGSPAINSNTFANRPAAGQTGRLFVSTDTFEIYRDNGTTWDLIGGPGSSTITGTGTATQVAYFTSSQAIGSSANLFWDNTNTRLGIGTATPGSRLDIHGTGTLQTNNSTGATNNNYLQLQRAGANVWRIGDTYNGGTNFYSIFNSGLSTNAALFYAATNKGEFTATETIATGLAIGTQFTYNLTVPNATTFGTPNAITALGMFTNMTLQGNSTVPVGTRQGFDANQRISFTTNGTMTINQGSTIRAFSNLNTVWSFNGSATGTISHLAGIRVVFPDNIGSAVNVTNNYGILINSQTPGLGTINYTNRYGIYQEGSNDINVFGSNTIINGNINVGYQLDVQGTLRVTSDSVFAIGGGTGMIIGTNVRNASAILEASSTTAGFLPPRMTTTQRNAIVSPVAGLTIYNSTTGALEFYNGSTWSSGGGGGITGSGTTNYLPKFTAGTVVGDSRFFDNGTVTFLGNGDVNAAPSTGIFSGTGGTGTNIAGAELRIRGGASTGNAAGGPLTFYTSAAGASGSGANAALERMRITSGGNVGIGTTTIGSTLQVNGNAAIGYSASRAASTNGLAIAGNLNVGTGWTTQDAWIEIGTERTGNGFGYIDITTDTTYTDYGLRIIRGNTGANASSLITVRGTGGISIITEEAGAINFNTTNTNRLTIPAAGGLTFADANNIAFNTTTGTKIGTATSQKLAFWNATPIVQPTTGVAGAARVAGGGATVTDTDTFGGYTIAQVVAALRNVGLLA